MPLPEAFNTTVAFAPLLMLYVTVAFGVPVIVNTALAPEHIGLLLVNAVTVGFGVTVTVVLLVNVLLQLPKLMLDKVIV